MRWLLDEMLPHAAAEALRQLGHDAISVTSINLRQAPDSEVYSAAVVQDRVLVTEDRSGFTPLAKRDIEAGETAATIVLVHRNDFGRKGALSQHLADALHDWSLRVPKPLPGPHYL